MILWFWICGKRRRKSCTIKQLHSNDWLWCTDVNKESAGRGFFSFLHQVGTRGVNFELALFCHRISRSGTCALRYCSSWGDDEGCVKCFRLVVSCESSISFVLLGHIKIDEHGFDFANFSFRWMGGLIFFARTVTRFHISSLRVFQIGEKVSNNVGVVYFPTYPVADDVSYCTTVTEVSGVHVWVHRKHNPRFLPSSKSLVSQVEMLSARRRIMWAICRVVAPCIDFVRGSPPYFGMCVCSSSLSFCLETCVECAMFLSASCLNDRSACRWLQSCLHEIFPASTLATTGAALGISWQILEERIFSGRPIGKQVGIEATRCRLCW